MCDFGTTRLNIGFKYEGGRLLSRPWTVSPKELKLMKELAAAGRQGRTVLTANRSGPARMIEKHYVKTSLIGVHGVRYVITDRGFGRLHVLPVAIDFLKVYPDIDIRLALADRVFDLREDRVDLAIRIGALPDSSLKASRVGSIRHVVCGSPGYFAKRGTPKNPLELRNHDCITFEGLTSPDTWTFTVKKSKKPIAIHSRLVVNTAEAAIERSTLTSTSVLHSRIACSISVKTELIWRSGLVRCRIAASKPVALDQFATWFAEAPATSLSAVHPKTRSNFATTIASLSRV